MFVPFHQRAKGGGVGKREKQTGTQIQGGEKMAKGRACMVSVTADGNGHCNVQRLL
jgi:hypothetical protein